MVTWTKIGWWDDLRSSSSLSSRGVGAGSSCIPLLCHHLRNVMIQCDVDQWIGGRDALDAGNERKDEKL